MKCLTLAVVLPCFLLILSVPAQAQISFFQPPTFAGSGSVFAADFNGDGKTDLLSSDGTMNLGKGDGTFTAGTVVSVPSGYSMLAVADFNGDGKPDVLEQNAANNMSLTLLGKGDGTFQPAIHAKIGGGWAQAVTVDLNGDGKADFVALSASMYGSLSNLFVYLSKGDGTFTSPVFSYNTNSVDPWLALGDFNGDKKPDIVLFIAGTTTVQMLVFLGNGDGTFQAPKTTSLMLSGSGYGTVVGDFNGDGNLDVFLNGDILLGNGDGTFQPPTFVGAIVATLTADVNGDGKLDLIGQQGPQSVQIYLGNGDGTFSTSGMYIDSSVGGAGLAVVDFNGDGKLDIAAGNTVLLGNGDGTFQGIIPSFVGGFGGLGSQVIGEFASHGTEDVAVACVNANVLSNSGNGQLSLIQTYGLALYQQSFTIAMGDFNGDGKLDLFAVSIDADPNDDSWGYSILLGNGDGTFQPPVFYQLGGVIGVFDDQQSTYSVIVADFNNDGKLDVAISLYGGAGNSNLALLMGNGDGTFATPSQVFDGGGQYLVSADFNGDGKLDIAAGPGYDGTTALLFGNGDGTFQAPVFPSNLKNFGSLGLFVADLNNDGKPDLIAGTANGYQVALGNGDGTFTVLPSTSTSSGFDAVNAIADLNGDGKPDAVVTQYSSNWAGTHTGIMLGNGDGTFGSLIDLYDTASAFDLGPYSIRVADMNGDGRPDIVFLWSEGIVTLFNTTPIGFSLSATSLSPSTITAGSSATSTVSLASRFGFAGTVNLSCTITPVVTAAPTCSLSSSSAQITGTGTQTVTVKVGTTAPVTTVVAPNGTLPAAPMPLAWMLMLLSSPWLWARNRKRPAVLAAPLVLLAFAFAAGCGGSGSSSLSSHTIPGTPAGTYTATVTGTSGSISHSFVFEVVVQ